VDRGKRAIETYERISSVLKAENISVSNYQLIDYGLQFLVYILDWSGIIRIYENKKGGLKIDYSQLKNGENVLRIQRVIEGQGILNSEGNGKAVELGFPVIGTDESGKGDYFGPLVSAGVYVDEQSANELIACGVRDSKTIGDNKNLDLAREIPKICKGRFSIIEVSPDKYNDLYEQFKSEGGNLNTLLAWGHGKAIEEILNKVECRLAVADQFADERFILGKLQEKGKKLKLLQMHKAEQNIAVAAASILSRARFLEKLSKLSAKYRIAFPKGSSREVVRKGREFVTMYGRETLSKVAKLHFRITNQIIDQS
jgi:ribonuclease HIII